jgi:hypothetical protein
MRRPRFTIANLLVIVVFLAIGLGALREATDIWDSGVFGVILTVLLISVLLIIHRKGIKRAYWIGFALFGGSYLVMTLVPSVETRLPTTKGLAYLDSKVSDRLTGWTFVVSTDGVGGNTGKPVQGAAFSVGGSTPTTNRVTSLGLWNMATGGTIAGSNGSSENFLRNGHSLLGLLMAIFGAHLSRYLCVSGRPGRAEEGEPSQTHPQIDGP